MFPLRPNSRLPLAGMMAALAGVLIWLLLIYGADHRGFVALPDAAGSKVEFYVDREGQLTRAEIARLPASAWRIWKGVKLLVDEGGRALWTRVTLRNPHDRPAEAILAEGDYFVDRFDVWVPKPGAASSLDDEAGWQHFVAGEAIPVRDRPIWGRDAAFPVTVPAQGESVIYMRATDYVMACVRLGWWPRQQDFHAAQSRQSISEGIYFGALLGLFGYNVMLWLRLRLVDIGYYAAYLGGIGVCMFLARARVAELGWLIASPGLEAALACGIALTSALLVQFARAFLEIKKRWPAADRWVRGWCLVLTLTAILNALTPWFRVWDEMRAAVLASGLTHIVLLTLAIQAWRHGARQARFFLLAFGCLFASSLTLVPVWLNNTNAKHFTILAMMIGSALEMILLSLAVADRFAQAQRERAIAQEKLIEETEQRRAIQEAYADELAVEVRERTKDLEAANADKDRMIAVIGHDLRSPLTSLMQTAEQLALTPEDAAAFKKYAADSAQVGRQTLLLIEDLVLWARLRAGLRSPTGRHAARALVAPVVALHRAFAGQRGVELAVDVPESLRLSTDLVLAQTLLRNLVANALKFARTRVEVRATEEAGGVRLTVRDDGPGLPAAVMAAFTREFPEPADAESGLGLRLCVEISRALDTKLEVALTPEGGTEFKLKLPL